MKLLNIDGVGYPTSKVVKIEPATVLLDTSFETLSDDFHVQRKVNKDVIVNVYMEGMKAPIEHTMHLNSTGDTVYLPTDPDFLEWLGEQTLESGKDPLKIFKGSLAKVLRIRQMIKDAENAKASNTTLVQNAAPVVAEAVQTSTPVEMQTIETEEGVTLDVALRDLTDEPPLPFTPAITVQPEMKTDALIANEEILPFANPTVSDEDLLLLKKKEKTVKKWLMSYIEEINSQEAEEHSLIAKRGVELSEDDVELKNCVVNYMEDVL